MTLSRTVSAEDVVRSQTAVDLPGKVTSEPGREWQVRNWSAICGPLIDGEEEPRAVAREGRRVRGGPL